MKYFALSLMVVLAMASVSMAGYHVDLADGSVDVSDPVALGNDLYSFTITMNGYGAYSGLYVDGLVHQCEGSGLGINPTLFDDQIAVYDAAACVYDTHAILPESYLKIDGDNTVDAISQAGVPDVDSSGFAYFNQTGMGTFSMDNGAITYSGTAPASMDIAQIVVLDNGTPVRLCGVVTTAGGVQNVLMDKGVAGVPLDVPEPGTIVMLLAGALCMLGIRRK